MSRIESINDFIPYEDLLNKKTPTFKSELKAYCSSYQCYQNPKSTLNGLGKIKHVSRNVMFCPDCSSALYWMRDDQRAHEINKKRGFHKKDKK